LSHSYGEGLGKISGLENGVFSERKDLFATQMQNISYNLIQEPPDTGVGRVLSFDASFGLLATASASALALFLGSALGSCGVGCMI